MRCGSKSFPLVALMNSFNRLSPRLVIWISLLSLILPISATGLSQTTSIQKADIYTNFLGTWVGTGSFIQDHGRVTVPLQITITETKKKDAIRCDYIWSKKGEKYYLLHTKFLTLLPAKSEIVQQYKDAGKLYYQAKGLDEFSQTGFGTFTGAAILPGSGHPITAHSTFDLETDSFKYKAETSLDGQNFVVGQILLLTRAPITSTVPAQ
jgi:hypothetical protein